MSNGDRLLPLAEAEKKAGLKKSAIYARVASGEFPRPIKIGCATRWSEKEIDEWIERMKQTRCAA